MTTKAFAHAAIVISLVAASAHAAPLDYRLEQLAMFEYEAAWSPDDWDYYDISYDYDVMQSNSSGQIVGRTTVTETAANAEDLPYSYSTGASSQWYYDGSDYQFSIAPLQFETFSFASGTDLLLNNAGHLAGPTDSGKAYFYDGNNPAQQIGLYDATHTDVTPGYIGGTKAEHWNRVTGLGENGHVVGTARRYTAEGNSYLEGAVLGQSSWIFDGTTTTKIGLVDSEHTRTTTGWRNGEQYSESQLINNTGMAAGYSDRYEYGATQYIKGTSAWLYDGSTTTNIGLTDAAHTRSDDRREASVNMMNDAGDVIGTSDRYNVADEYDPSQTHWLYSAGTTRILGFQDAEHTRDTDGHTVTSAYLNQAGQVLGTSERFAAGGATLGRSLWLADSSQTKDISIKGAEYTRASDGYRLSGGVLNNAGQVVISASRFGVDSASLGSDLFFYENDASAMIGLTDSQHTRDTDGYRRNRVWEFADTGSVAGYALRYGIGGVDLGVTSWLYDGTETVALDSLSQRSDGYAFSSIFYLGDDNSMFGYYNKYDESDVLLGRYLFGYNETDGIFDMDIGMAQQYSKVLSVTDDGEIIFIESYVSDFAYIDGIYKVSAVPIPASVWLMGSALGLLGFWRRKHLSA